MQFSGLEDQIHNRATISVARAKAGKKDEDPSYEEVIKRRESCFDSAKGYKLGSYFLLPAPRATFEKEARDKVTQTLTQLRRRRGAKKDGLFRFRQLRSC